LDEDLSILGRAPDPTTLAEGLPQSLEVFLRTYKARDERYLLAPSLLAGEREAKALPSRRERRYLGTVLLRGIAIVGIGAVEHP
jgi:hypothetical protein